jgi:hypothetical protein
MQRSEPEASTALQGAVAWTASSRLAALQETLKHLSSDGVEP